MKNLVIIIGLFLLGTAFSVKAQEMTPKEKHSYAIGVILGEKIKSSGINVGIIDTLEEKIDFKSIKEGIRDDLIGECKLTKEEIKAELAEAQKRMDYFNKLSGEKKNQNGENEKEKSLTTEDYLSILANNYGNLSWYYLFIKDYAQSEQSARKALELDKAQTWVKANLAHALLFLNHFSEAEKIYKELSQTIVKDNETYTKALLKDFEELEKAGVIPEKRKADVEKIRKMLQE